MMEATAVQVEAAAEVVPWGRQVEGDLAPIPDKTAVTVRVVAMDRMVRTRSVKVVKVGGMVSMETRVGGWL